MKNSLDQTGHSTIPPSSYTHTSIRMVDRTEKYSNNPVLFFTTSDFLNSYLSGRSMWSSSFGSSLLFDSVISFRIFFRMPKETLIDQILCCNVRKVRSDRYLPFLSTQWSFAWRLNSPRKRSLPDRFIGLKQSFEIAQNLALCLLTALSSTFASSFTCFFVFPSEFRMPLGRGFLGVLTEQLFSLSGFEPLNWIFPFIPLMILPSRMNIVWITFELLIGKMWASRKLDVDMILCCHHIFF